jgi:glutamyl-tRNA synthetase
MHLCVPLTQMVAVGDPNMRTLNVGDIIQIERRGFFRVDKPYESPDRPLTLFMIPDGKQKAMSTLTTSLAHR